MPAKRRRRTAPRSNSPLLGWLLLALLAAIYWLAIKPLWWLAKALGRLIRKKAPEAKDSWDQYMVSWKAMSNKKALLGLVFANALISVCLFAVVLGTFWLAFGGGVQSWTSTQWYSWVLVNVALVAVMLVSKNFFSGAIVCFANERFHGGNPTFISAVSGARARLKEIINWTMTGSFLSFIIVFRQAVKTSNIEFSERAKLALGAVLRLIWRLLSFMMPLVVTLEGFQFIRAFPREQGGLAELPIVILDEDKWARPLRSIARSEALLDREIRQQGLEARPISHGAIILIGALPALIFSRFMVSARAIAPAVVGGVIILVTLFVMVMLPAQNTVHHTALYHYAAKGRLPKNYSKSNLVYESKLHQARSAGGYYRDRRDRGERGERGDRGASSRRNSDSRSDARANGYRTYGYGTSRPTQPQRHLPSQWALEVFEFSEADADRLTAEMIDDRYRQLMKVAHPDKGGSDKAADDLNRAREMLKSWCESAAKRGRAAAK